MEQNKNSQKRSQIQKQLNIQYMGIMICIIAIFIILGRSFINYQNRIQLTQLGNQSHSQMMGYVIKTNKGKVIVIDGGTAEDSENLIEQIKKLGGKVDAWFLTHPHKDHVGAFTKIISQEESEISIQDIYVTLNDLTWYQENEPQRKQEIEDFFEKIQKEEISKKIQEVEIGQIIQIDSLKCEILGVKNPEITNNAINNSSMVIKMYVNNKSILFLGDTGIESSQKLIENQSENKLKSNIVQMAHHGQSGASEELYQIIKPEICLWPTPDWLWDNNAGEGINTGNWKTLETRLWMENLKVEKNIIEKDGNITIEIY